MEIPRSLGVQDNEEEEEYDSVFYEDIEAPKFVDLTAPDAACPADDPSWFCLRVGHGGEEPQRAAAEGHQQEKPELDAAEMPPLCAGEAAEDADDQAEPGDGGGREGGEGQAAGPPDSRPEGLPGPDQGGEGRRVQREEEGSDHAQEQDRAAEAGALPQRESLAAAEIKGTVVKALFMTTPKKETPAKSQAPPVAEVCSKMKKLNLACREVPSRYLSQLPTPKIAKKCEETAAAKRVQEPRSGKKMMILGCSAKCANAETDGGNRSGRENINADENSCKRTARRNWGQEPKEVLQGSRVEVAEPLQPDIHGDDKENAPCGDQLAEQALNREEEDENSKQSEENNENAPQKVLKRQNKVVNAEQGGKLKKNTILRPFRLRTDERQVLKDAIPERKPTVAEKNAMPVLKDENRRVMMQTGRCPDGKEREKLACGEKQRKQITYTATSRLGESKTVLSSIRPNNVRPAPALTKGKTVEKSQRAASSTRTAKITSDFTAPSRTGEKRKASVKTSRIQVAAA
uniref:Uncharacterized protein n=1 Tax=Aegilops tauschii TaxID=37682 RepID=R7W9C3_AEGTA